MNTEFILQDDAPIPPEPALRDLPLKLGNLPRWPALALIRLYQATISRGLPPNTCRFYPSCSHYGYQAIYKHGAIKGSLMAAWLPHGVGIHPQAAGLRKSSFHFGLQLLRAQASIPDAFETTRGTADRGARVIITVVTDHGIMVLVMRESDITFTAAYNTATRGTLDMCRKPAAV